MIYDQLGLQTYVAAICFLMVYSGFENTWWEPCFHPPSQRCSLGDANKCEVSPALNEDLTINQGDAFEQVYKSI